MDKNSIKIIDLKKRIDKAKTEIAELRGQKNQILGQLKDDWGLLTLKEVNDKLEELSDEIDSLTSKFNSSMEKIYEKYDIEKLPKISGK